MLEMTEDRSSTIIHRNSTLILTEIETLVTILPKIEKVFRCQINVSETP